MTQIRMVIFSWKPSIWSINNFEPCPSGEQRLLISPWELHEVYEVPGPQVRQVPWKTLKKESLTIELFKDEDQAS